MAGWWGRQFATQVEPMTLDQVLDRIDAVSADDVQRLAQDLWRPQRMALAFVGPMESESRLQAWLESQI